MFGIYVFYKFLIILSYLIIMIYRYYYYKIVLYLIIRKIFYRSFIRNEQLRKKKFKLYLTKWKLV